MTRIGRNKKTQGFSLLELIIYVAIFAIVSSVMVGIMIMVLKIGQEQSASAEVAGQLNFVMQTISRLTRESSAIIVNDTDGDVSNDGSPLGTNYSRLVLRVKDSSGSETDRDPIIIWRENSTNRIKISEGNPARINYLTTDQVKVDQLQFRKTSQSPGHDTVSIDMQLTYNSSNPNSQITRTLHSAIARVSAATFDSNLVPSSSDRNLGQAGSAWQYIYMSDGSAGSPSYTFDSNPVSGMFKAAQDMLGFSTNGSERMRIGSDGNVAIMGADNGIILKSSGGICHKLRVDDGGVLSTISVACPY